MVELVWHECHPPRDLDLAAVTAMLRPLAGRPKLGMLRRTPVAVFEAWSDGGHLRWLLGVEPMLGNLPEQLKAQLPRLAVVKGAAGRPALDTAVELRLNGLANPLRLDTAEAVSAGIVGLLASLHKDERAVCQWVLGPAQQRRVRPLELSTTQALGLAPLHEEDAQDRQLWKAKTAESLYAVRGRIGVVAKERRQGVILRSLVSALQLANAPHAELRAGRPSRWAAKRLANVYQPGGTWSCVLNGAELAACLGWPLQNAGAVALGGRHVRPVPKALLVPAGSTTTDRILGASLHPADKGQWVRVPASTNGVHWHVTGTTGTGKSTMLANWARADIAAGKSVFVMEPRGDLVRDILAGIPDGRRDDVVVISPGDSRPVGINPLHGAADQAERRADELLHLFEHWFGSGVGPRSRDILLHCLIALARSADGTLADLVPLLTQQPFRKRLLAQVGDPLTLNPFFAWYEGLSDTSRDAAVSPALNKARAILSPTATRRLLGQAEPKFDLEDLFAKRRIVLVNLNAGTLGSDTAEFVAGLVLSLVWNGIQRRAAVPPAERHPAAIIVDEAANYLKLPVDLGDALAQSRAVGAQWVLANQHLDQLPPRLESGFLANARSRAAFRSSVTDTKRLAATLGGGITPDDLEQLGAFEACARMVVDNATTAPFSVKTLPLPPDSSDPDELLAYSRGRYGMDGQELDRIHTERWQGSTSAPPAPIGVKRWRQA